MDPLESKIQNYGVTKRWKYRAWDQGTYKCWKNNEAEAFLEKHIAGAVEKQREEHGQYFYELGKVKQIKLKLKYKEAYGAFINAVNSQPENALYLNEAGLAAVQIALYDQAQPLFRKGLEIRQRVLGEEHPSTAASYNNVASNLNAQGKYEQAEPLLRKGLEINQRVLGEEHWNTKLFAKNLEVLLKTLASASKDTLK